MKNSKRFRNTGHLKIALTLTLSITYTVLGKSKKTLHFGSEHRIRRVDSDSARSRTDRWFLDRYLDRSELVYRAVGQNSDECTGVHRRHEAGFRTH